jgi:alpha-beta hydrolase superfamily lysophospholipase
MISVLSLTYRSKPFTITRKELDTFYVKDSEGKSLFTRVWKPKKIKPKAILQIIHGMSEHSGRYSHVGRYFSERGFIVVAHDHRGHGRTDPDHLGHIGHERGLDALSENIGDIKNHIAKEHPNLPIIMLGHSMGSFCLQRYFQLTNDRADAIIYSGSNGRPSRLLPVGIWITSALMKIWGGKRRSTFLDNLLSKSFNRHFKPSRTKADWLSRDETMVGLFLDDPLCDKTLTVQFLYALFTGLRDLHHHKPFADHDKNIPILLLSGDHDPVSNMGKGVRNLEKLIRKSGIKQVDVNLYKDGRHEMLNEINRDEVMNDLHGWIQKNVQS